MLGRNGGRNRLGTSGIAGVLLLAAACGQGDRSAEPSASPRESDVAGETGVFAVEGMVCDGCAEGLAKLLKGVPGVAACSVSYASGAAWVTMRAGELGPVEVEREIEEIGYSARYIGSATEPPPVSGS